MKLRPRLTTLTTFTLAILSITYLFSTSKRNQIGNQRPKFTSFQLNQIWMSNEEARKLQEYTSNVNNYLEWGSGGSTLNIAPQAKVRAVSIEHDPEWCKRMSRTLELRNLTYIEFYCVPRKRTSQTDGTYPEFRPYINKIDSLHQETWDFILIDGRARVVAAIKALAYISQSSIVALHDFCRISYPHKKPNCYSPVLHFYNVIDYTSQGQAIGFLKRKPQFQWLQGNLVAIQTILDMGDAIFSIRTNATKTSHLKTSKSCTF